MSSLFIRGETGEVRLISSLSDLKNSYTKMIQSGSLNSNEVEIYSSKGLSPTNISQVEFEKDVHYFVYARHFTDDAIRMYNESLDKLSNPSLSNISINLASIPDIDSVLYILEPNAQKLKNFSPQELRVTKNKMMEFYDNFQLIYKTMKTNCNICDKIKESYQYQFEGVSLVYRSIKRHFEASFQKQKETENSFKTLRAKNEETIKQFNDCIDKMHKIELHPGTQLNGQKFLSDIFLEESTVEPFKKKCIQDEENLFIKIEKLANMLQENRTEIDKKNIGIFKQLQNDWGKITKEYDKLYRERTSKPSEVMKELEKDFIMFNNKMKNIVEIFNGNLYNEKNSNIEKVVSDSIETIKILKNKYSNISLLSNLQSFLEPINEITYTMKKSIEVFPRKINELFNHFSKIRSSLNSISDKSLEYIQALGKVEKDFSYFKIALKFPVAYQNSIAEFKRRIIFNKKIMKDFLRLNGLVMRENLSRKQFHKEIEPLLNMTYFRNIKQNEIKLKFEYMNDNELATLPNVLTEEDEKQISEGGFLSDTTTKGAEAKNSSASKNCDDESLIKNLTTKLEDLDVQVKTKESEIKKLNARLELELKKNSDTLNQLKGLNFTFESMTESFFSRLEVKEKKLEKLKKECENLKKYVSSTNEKFDTCPLCRESIIKSAEYQTCKMYIKDIKEELVAKSKQCSKFELDYKELLEQTTTIKKTFFLHMNQTIEKKNIELTEIKSYYENKIMCIEDQLSSLNEKMLQESGLKSTIISLQNKVKDFNILFSDLDKENKKLKFQNEELLQKENGVRLDLKIIQTKYDNLSSEYKKLEASSEGTKMKLIKTSDELVGYIKENNKIKNEIDNKIKENIELTKSLGILKNESDGKISKIQMKHFNEISGLQKEIRDLNDKCNSQLTELTKLSTSLSKEISINDELKQKVNTLENEINEKDKKILEISDLAHLTTKDNTNAQLTNDLNMFTNSAYLTIKNDEEVINFKRTEKGLRCIFVPYSEGIYVSINLSEQLIKNDSTFTGQNKYFRCRYILNLKDINDDIRGLIVENSLIVIGRVGKLEDYTPTDKYNPYGLPQDEKFILVTLDKMDYVIGFPGEDIVFRNYFYN